MFAIDTTRQDEALTRYLTEIARYPLLTAEEEHALAQRAHAGDIEARQRLITANLRLVVMVAKRFHPREMTLLDIIQEGNLGLMHAVEKYDPATNNRFATYAVWWIRQAIGRALIERDGALKMPAHLHEEARRVRRATEYLSVELGRAPTDTEIAARAEVSLATLRTLAALPSRQIVSLDAPLFSGGEHAPPSIDDTPLRSAFLADDTPLASVEEQVEARDAQNHLYELLRAHLEPRELAVVALRYRLGNLAHANMRDNDESKPLAYRHVGHKLGISGEMARLIEGEALTKLRKALALTADGLTTRTPAKKKKAPTATTAKGKKPATANKQRTVKQMSLFGDVA